MWTEFTAKHNGSKNVSMVRSFFVGDAAGRPAAPPTRPKKDFSDTDRAFASNICLPFKTESEFFLDKPTEAFTWESKTGSELLLAAGITNPTVGYAAQPTTNYAASTPEMVICVAPPASGKSSFVKRHLLPHGYTYTCPLPDHHTRSCN